MMLPDAYLDLQREFERIQRYNNLIYSPIQGLVDEQRRMAETVAGPALELQRMMASITESESFAALRRMMEEREALLAQSTLYDVSREIEETTRTWASSFDHIREQVEEAARIAGGMRWTSHIAEQAAGLAAISEESLRLMELAGATLHDRLAMFEDAETVEERQALLPLLLRALISWIDTVPPAVLSKQAVVRVVKLFIIVATVYGPISGHMLQESVEEWREEAAASSEELEGLLKELSDKMDALAADLEAAPVFRTTCPLPLRVAPHGKARRVGTVPVNILLEQMDQQGRWLSVVYLDLQSGMPVAGWVYKRGLVLANIPVEEEGHCSS